MVNFFVTFARKQPKPQSWTCVVQYANLDADVNISPGMPLTGTATTEELEEREEESKTLANATPAS